MNFRMPFFFFLGPYIFSVALQLISFPITYLHTERGVSFFFSSISVCFQYGKLPLCERLSRAKLEKYHSSTCNK